MVLDSLAMSGARPPVARQRAGKSISARIQSWTGSAYRFGSDRGYTNQVRARLSSVKSSAPLFDAAAFARDLERLYSDLVAQS